MTITTLGIDIAKSVFQLHGVDADGAVVLQKKLRRGAVLDCLGKLEPCLIGMEACATSHHWAREIAALGHDVRLIPPAYVKPYLRRLLVVGATSVTRRAPTNDTRTGAWVRSLLERKPARVVTVAIANKTARTAWALLAKSENYRIAPAI